MDKPKKKWYKRWWAITIWVFLGLAFLGALFGEEPSTPQMSSQSQIKTDKPEPQSSGGSAEIQEKASAPEQIRATKSLIQMMPTRDQIPTEFKMEKAEPYNLSSEGFEEAIHLLVYKIVGSLGTGVVQADFYVRKFSSPQSARANHFKEVNRIKNEGGYSEYSIRVPSGAECFAFLEDYGFVSKFATAKCISENIDYEVLVTADQTIEKPEKYLKDMIKTFDENIHS